MSENKKTYLSKEVKANNQHIPSVKYYDHVMAFADKVRQVPGVDSSAVNIFTHNGERTWLSTTPAITVEYSASGYYRGDAIYSLADIKKNKTFYEIDYRDFDDMQREAKKLREKFNLHQVYHFSRSCSDCIVVCSCNAIEAVADPVAFYEQTINGMEDWLNEFLDGTMNIFCEYLPTLGNTRFVSDAHFRHTVIKTREHITAKLNRSEKKVLYWSALGKTAAEIAIILSLSPETVTSYRKNCIKALNASNITHAIFLAQLHGVI